MMKTGRSACANAGAVISHEEFLPEKTVPFVFAHPQIERRQGICQEEMERVRKVSDQ
jgi:hypothetical protein